MVRLAEQDSRVDGIVATVVPLVRPELVLLFGSRASGTSREDSDYDLMLVLRDDADVAAQRLAASDALRRAGISADVLARATSDYQHRQHDPGCLEWLVSRQGRLLYASGAIPQTSPAPSVREREPDGFREWLLRSESDFATAELVLTAVPPREPRPDAVCFHSHACVEKLLKALIARGGIFPPRTHDLIELLARLPQAAGDRVTVSACERLQALYPASRYPELPMPSLQDAHDAFDAARVVRERLVAQSG